MSAERVRKPFEILNFPGVNPGPTLPTLQLNPPRPATSTRLRGIDYFGRTPDFKINQFLELNRKKNRHLLKTEAFSPDGNLDIDALMSLIHFIENGDSNLAPNLDQTQRLDLVTKLISKFLRFPKPKFDLFDLGKKLLGAEPKTITKLNSLELRSLENPRQRKTSFNQF